MAAVVLDDEGTHDQACRRQAPACGTSHHQPTASRRCMAASSATSGSRVEQTCPMAVRRPCHRKLARRGRAGSAPPRLAPARGCMGLPAWAIVPASAIASSTRRPAARRGARTGWPGGAPRRRRLAKRRAGRPRRPGLGLVPGDEDMRHEAVEGDDLPHRRRPAAVLRRCTSTIIRSGRCRVAALAAADSVAAIALHTWWPMPPQHLGHQHGRPGRYLQGRARAAPASVDAFGAAAAPRPSVGMCRQSSSARRNSCRMVRPRMEWPPPAAGSPAARHARGRMFAGPRRPAIRMRNTINGTLGFGMAVRRPRKLPPGVPMLPFARRLRPPVGNYTGLKILQYNRKLSGTSTTRTPSNT